MDNNKILIIGLVVIIGILLVGIFAIVPNLLKEDTILNFNSASTLKEGDTLAVVLVDDNGNPIAGEKVNITVTDSNGSSDYHSVLTDASGNGKLKLDKGPGDYQITISYGGNNKYKESSASKKIKIEEEQQEATASLKWTTTCSTSMVWWTTTLEATDTSTWTSLDLTMRDITSDIRYFIFSSC